MRKSQKFLYLFINLLYLLLSARTTPIITNIITITVIIIYNVLFEDEVTVEVTVIVVADTLVVVEV